MKKKKVMWCETAWYNSEEWEKVRGLVLERDRRAVEMMKVWRCRMARLPAGVETTLSLLEADSVRPLSPLSLALYLTFTAQLVLDRINTNICLTLSIAEQSYKQTDIFALIFFEKLFI